MMRDGCLTFRKPFRCRRRRKLKGPQRRRNRGLIFAAIDQRNEAYDELKMAREDLEIREKLNVDLTRELDESNARVAGYRAALDAARKEMAESGRCIPDECERLGCAEAEADCVRIEMAAMKIMMYHEIAKRLATLNKCPVFPCPIKDKSQLATACVNCWLKFIRLHKWAPY